MYLTFYLQTESHFLQVIRDIFFDIFFLIKRMNKIIKGYFVLDFYFFWLKTSKFFKKYSVNIKSIGVYFVSLMHLTLFKFQKTVSTKKEFYLVDCVLIK